MNETARFYLQKMLFWQRLAALVLSVFILTQWIGFGLYFILDDFNLQLYIDKVGLGVCVLFLIGEMYLNYLLYKGARALKQYLATSNLVDLELSIRQQRYFWLGVVTQLIIVMLLGILFLAMI
ncbi:hypothetical protein [Aureispira anguillae]|uniref:Uncharacterized protein n=1 Tax=Aureispira anguillae TaxID=2864201 RepID=A0A916DT99_9BACT|nr:hypothetical protein [Aureispira anguillae]BDS11695.1 hypothetical protein AsAng_0024090 [Aureispira anguillae]